MQNVSASETEMWRDGKIPHFKGRRRNWTLSRFISFPFYWDYIALELGSCLREHDGVRGRFSRFPVGR